MDWSNERYVRLYTRDTVNTQLLSWEARCVFWELLRKVDRSGVLEIGNVEPGKALAVALRVPAEVASTALAEWLADGRVELRDGAIVVPNHLGAQEAPQSDRARARASRERRSAGVTIRDEVSRFVTDPSQTVTQPSRPVTSRHTPSHAVTPAIPSDPIQTSQLEHVTTVAADAAPAAQSAKVKRNGHRLPDDWHPSPEAYAWAAAHEKVQLRRVDVDDCAEDFRNYWTARSDRGAAKLTWEGTFQNALKNWRRRNPTLPRATKPFVPRQPVAPVTAIPASEIAPPEAQQAVADLCGSLFRAAPAPKAAGL